jgi:hypothetical protein
MARSAATDEWVKRVLGYDVTSQAKGSGPVGGIQYRMLLLRWREAQGNVARNMTALGKAVLARQDVKSDSRLPQVEAAVEQLNRLVPSFGGELEDVLDRGINAGQTAEAAALAAEAIEAVDVYRRNLAGATQLAALEALAEREMGGSFRLQSALDEVLQDLRSALEKQV